MTFSRAHGVVLAVVTTVGLAGAVTAQPARPSATMDDVLAEVRGLRAEMRDAVASGIRAQLLVARLGLQEQRIGALSDQIVEARRAVSRTSSDRSMRSAHLRQLEEMRHEARNGDFEAMVSRVREELGQARLDEQAQHDREQDLTRILAEEQRLWADLNSRLEELERVLPAPRRQ